MLTLEIGGTEVFDPVTNEFKEVKPTTLELEHSLISLHKWESKWKIPFMKTSSENKLTREQTVDYYKCMSIKPIKDPNVFALLTSSQEREILEYIANGMTATTIKEKQVEGQARRRSSKEIVTAELIYYWMVELGIFYECRTWHLNQLLTLVRVCQEKQTVPKKMKKNDILGMYASENAKRRAMWNTKG